MFLLRRRDHEGFTLVELLIAIVVMGIAVAALVTALATLAVSTAQHRGHSVTESIIHDYAEAIEQKAYFTTPLTADITSTTTSVSVGDATGFQTATPFYVVLEQEIMKVTSVSGSTLTVQRAQKGTDAAAHNNPMSGQRLRLSQLFVCPGASSASGNQVGYLAPDGYTPAAGNPVLPPVVTVSYWNPTTNSYSAVGDASACLAYFTAHCGAGSFQPQCDPGLELVTISLQTTGQQYQNTKTSTEILIRRNST